MWGVFPRWLGYLTLIAGPSLIMNSLLILIAGVEGGISALLMFPYFASIVWLASWLLINTPHPSKNREFGFSKEQPITQG